MFAFFQDAEGEKKKFSKRLGERSSVDIIRIRKERMGNIYRGENCNYPVRAGGGTEIPYV